MHGPVAVGGHAPCGGRDEQAAGELVINGRFLCQPATGVQRVAREFVLALERLLVRGEFPGLRARLVAPTGAEFGSLNLARIATQHLAGGTGHYWEQVTLPRHAGGAHLLCLGNLAPLRSLIAGAPVAVMLHDQSFRTFKSDYSLPYRLFHEVVGHFLVRRARPLITVSQTEAEAIRAANGGRPEQLVVAPNGSWMNDEPAPPRPAPDTAAPPYVLHVGGFSERKNVGRVFAAAEVLAGDGVEVRLVGRPNARCEEWLEGLSPEVRAKVRFTGFVDNAQLTRLYSEAACLMYPSLYEPRASRRARRCGWAARSWSRTCRCCANGAGRLRSIATRSMRRAWWPGCATCSAIRCWRAVCLSAGRRVRRSSAGRTRRASSCARLFLHPDFAPPVVWRAAASSSGMGRYGTAPGGHGGALCDRGCSW
ncbi:glycosyltransferase [Novosphingobium sp. MBES04]|uniref:glycosyltransferase n=1 Tax=Novosphingobium sp. MBES04 TaxID=1206458 RepID=UPI001184C7B4|nr:glycosyltransferase [Novosphingobium sp. MBES04]